MLTRGTFTSIQWTFLMRLFVVHPPWNLNSDRRLSESRCSEVSQQMPLAMSSGYSNQRVFESGPLEEKLADSSYGVRSAWGKPHARTNWFLKRCFGKHNAFCGTTRRRIRHLLARNLSPNKHERTSIAKEAHVEVVWKSFGKQFFATISLQEKVTMRSAMEHKYPDVQFIVDALARGSVVLTAEEDLLPGEDNFKSFKTGTRAMVSPRHSVLANIHEAEAYIFPTLFRVWEEARCGILQEMLKASGWTTVKKTDQTLEKAPTRNSSIANSMSTAQLLATIKWYVSSTLDELGQECVLETFTHRIIFMAMMNELELIDKLHKNDDVRIQQVQEVCDHTARLWPRDWFFVGPGSDTTGQYGKWETNDPNGNWDRKSSQILQQYKESGRPVVPGDTVFEQKKAQESIHFNTSPETVRMMCRRVESVNHHCILLLATTRYMEDLPEKTLIEAQESDAAPVKLAPLNRKVAHLLKQSTLSRRETSCTKNENKEVGTSPTDHTNGRRWTPRARSNRRSARNGHC